METKGKNRSYTQEEKQFAKKLYCKFGFRNLAELSRFNGIKYSTLDNWKRDDLWDESIVEQVPHSMDFLLSLTQKTTAKAYIELLDAMMDGKEGGVERWLTRCIQLSRALDLHSKAVEQYSESSLDVVIPRLKKAAKAYIEENEGLELQAETFTHFLALLDTYMRGEDIT